MKNKKLTAVLDVLFYLLIPLGICFLTYFVSKIPWYAGALGVCGISLLWTFLKFERKKTSPRELALLASTVAIAVASRALFYFAPQVKPIGAVAIIAAICFGKENGFIVGSLSMLLSNFIFGQGITTPFQMLGLGLTAYVSALVCKIDRIRNNRFAMAGVCSIILFVCYGLTVDLCSAVMLGDGTKSVLTFFASGAVFNLVFAVTTFVVLCLLAPGSISRIDRIKEKYGVFKNEENM